MARRWWILGLVVVFGCKGRARREAPLPEPSTHATAIAASDPPAPERKPILTQMNEAPNWRAAFALTALSMGDPAFGKDSSGAMVFAVWAIDHVRWSDIEVAENETTVARVLKDDEPERGKRFCAPVTIIQITAMKYDEDIRLDESIVMTGGGALIRFLSFGSSGNLVERNTARVCGVMTGRYVYPNSGGGTGHAAAAVGMFDLPQNRGTKTAPAAPTPAETPGPCDPPYVTNADGRRVFKPACL